MYQVDEDDNSGWGDYPDVRDTMQGLGTLGALAYLPDLGPVGSGSAGTYYPRNTSDDAAALNYLGFLPSSALADHVGTTGSQAGDMGDQVGAWDPTFQLALRGFQSSVGLTPDGWIGPSSRQALALKVAEKNAGNLVIPPIPTPPNVLPPSPNPQPQPGPSGGEDHTVRNVAIVAGVLAALGVGYYAWKG